MYIRTMFDMYVVHIDIFPFSTGAFHLLNLINFPDAINRQEPNEEQQRTKNVIIKKIYIGIPFILNGR